MKKISLTQGKFALVDDEDFEELTKNKWQAHFAPSKCGQPFYATRTTPKNNGRRRTEQMHRVIMHAPSGLLVDHINGNGLDNRKSNLRICTRSQNARNKWAQRNNSSGYKGVYLNKKLKKWTSMIGHNGKLIYLGIFATPQLASDAYKKASKIYHGDFSKLK